MRVNFIDFIRAFFPLQLIVAHFKHNLIGLFTWVFFSSLSQIILGRVLDCQYYSFLQNTWGMYLMSPLPCWGLDLEGFQWHLILIHTVSLENDFLF